MYIDMKTELCVCFFFFLFYKHSCWFCFPLQIVSDSSSRHKVYYTINGPGIDVEPNNLFSLESETGAFYVLQSIDRELYPRFEVSHINSSN